MRIKHNSSVDPEIVAITQVHSALRNLDPGAQVRVIEYVADKLGVLGQLGASTGEHRMRETGPSEGAVEVATQLQPNEPTNEAADADGINSVAIKWMRRSGVTVQSLSSLFSFGDDIDLIASKVPGKSKTQRLHSVLLLKGVAAYLASGVPRVTHEQLKETALHYDAFDAPNFATHIKSFAPEIGGTKQSGYTLNARGLAAATELIKSIINNMT
jgi:hypothetical protein